MGRLISQLTAVVFVASTALIGFVPAASAVSCPTVGPGPTYTVTPPPTPGVDWSGCNLINANLTGANLAYANLSNVDLTGADLTSANFFFAQLRGANLMNAIVESTNFYGSGVSDVNLTGANLSNTNLQSSDLTGAFVTCSTTGILGTGMSGGGNTLPVGWALTSGTLTVPISACSSPSSGSSSAPEPVISTLTLDFTAQEASCKGGNPSGVQGTWVKLHSADECVQTGPRANASAVLLGWSTSSDFPVALARSQVAKGWGVIDDTINGVRMIFIPAGMSTFVSGDNKLVPIWGQ